MLARICLFLVLFLTAVSQAAEPRVRVLWELNSRKSFSYFKAASISETEGVIYIGDQEGYLYAISLEGDFRWAWKGRGGVYTKPAIAEDGTIYVSHYNGGFSAISKNGLERWTIPLGVAEGTSPTVRKDGTVSFIGGFSADDQYRQYYSKSCVVDRFGKVLSAKGASYGANANPQLLTNGNTLIRDTVQVPGPIAVRYDLRSISSDEKTVWSYQNVHTDAAVAPDGKIYVGDTQGFLVAFNPTGKQLWKTDLLMHAWSTPVLDPKGNIIVGTGDGYVYSVSRQGTVNWIFEPAGEVAFCGVMSSETRDWLKNRTRKFRPTLAFSPLFDKTGNVIIGAENRIYSISTEGKVIWSLDLGAGINTAAVMDRSGNIYLGVGSNGEKLSRFVAIKPPAGPSQSSR